MERFKSKMDEELLGINGRIGVAVEIDGEGYYFQSGEVFQSASVIKVPILIEGLHQAEKGKVNIDQLMSISHKVGGSGVLQAISSDAVMTMKDLMTLMITVSDNTATNMVIDLLGMDAINASMANMGLKHTVLNRKMMDFEAIEQGFDNYTCPIDMITCLKAINEGTYLSEPSRKAALEIMNYQQFRDKLPGMMDLDLVFAANKTGGLPRVEHDCGVFKYKGKTAYAAVLMDQLDDLFYGRQKISRIGKHIYDYLVEES